MTITLSASDIIQAAGIIVPLGCTGIYLAVRYAITHAVLALELRITEKYVTKRACQQIRAECDRHREREKGTGRHVEADL